MSLPPVHTFNDAISCPVCMSQSLAVVSILPVAITVLGGLKLKHTCKQSNISFT